MEWSIRIHNNYGKNEDIELPIFSLSTIVTTIDNFSFNMKLGEGGYVSIYKVYFKYMSISSIKSYVNSNFQGSC